MIIGVMKRVNEKSNRALKKPLGELIADPPAAGGGKLAPGAGYGFVAGGGGGAPNGLPCGSGLLGGIVM
ncbi:hypothetical protein GCM10009811_13940 [Nostocoides veronense]|uniref:Uncharacterized protein n=1 Tax=Nostocoides veronense TaxID=330836 RepID=A0ABP4XU40_9MICO